MPEPADFDLSPRPRAPGNDPDAAPSATPTPGPSRALESYPGSLRVAGSAPAEGDVKELRVKIDVSYHLKLHALKLLRNKKMSDAIEEALDHYFEHVVNEQQGLEGDGEMKRLF